MGLLVGGLVGVLVGLLLAPAPGEETRRVLGDRATETGGRVRAGALQVADKVRERATTISDRAAQSAAVLGRQVRTQVGGLVGTAQQALDETLRGSDGSAPAAAGMGEAAAAIEDQGGAG